MYKVDFIINRQMAIIVNTYVKSVQTHTLDHTIKHVWASWRMLRQTRTRMIQSRVCVMRWRTHKLTAHVMICWYKITQSHINLVLYFNKHVALWNYPAATQQYWLCVLFTLVFTVLFVYAFNYLWIFWCFLGLRKFPNTYIFCPHVCNVNVAHSVIYIFLFSVKCVFYFWVF